MSECSGNMDRHHCGYYRNRSDANSFVDGPYYNVEGPNGLVRFYPVYAYKVNKATGKRECLGEAGFGSTEKEAQNIAFQLNNG